MAASAGCVDQGRILNGLNHVTVLPFGLGAVDTLEFRRIAVTRGMIDSTLGERRDAPRTSMVPVARFDWLWPLVNGADPVIHGVKIDVQGMELDTLAGMREALARWRPRLVVELHAGVSRELAMSLLTDAGYSTDAEIIEPAPGEREPRFTDDRSYAFHPR
jgi:FkbM family methyltransferase